MLRLVVGHGVEVIAGETDRTVSLDGAPLKLRLRRTEHGPVSIRGSLQIPGADSRSYDFCEALLELEFKRFRFRPATSPRGPVADYAVLRVRVVPNQ